MADFLLNMMLQVHIQHTNLANSPFPYKINFDYENVDESKLLLMTKSTDELNNFVKICFDEFVLTHPNILKGSIHINPLIWTKFALKSISQTYKDKQSEITFPNGCCSQNSNCPINMFYLVVMKNIMLKK